jgi:glucose-6-phosphate isomerase, archaeal
MKEVPMISIPFGFDLKAPDFLPSHYDNHIQRRLSSMKGQYLDEQAFEAELEKEDRLLYEVYEIRRPQVAGELLHGVSVIHPGRVGREYTMTKGHFHGVLETAEVYYCLQGEGCMVMETPEGDWSVERFWPGRVLYVPPRWAHRSVNTGAHADLVFFFIYPGNSGHDYQTIERQGFRKLVVETPTGAQVIDNPRWRGAAQAGGSLQEL